MRKSLYQVAVLCHTPTDNDEVNTQLVSGIQVLLANSSEEAKIEAVRNIPANIPSDQVEVIVRPF